jgi:hypothetical protein
MRSMPTAAKLLCPSATAALAAALILAGNFAEAQTSRPSTRPASQQSDSPTSAGSTSRPTSAPNAASGEESGPASHLRERMEKAHGAEAWHSRQAFQARAKVSFGGREILNGTMLFDVAVGRVRMELDNGTVAVFDGEKAWVSPEEAELPNARFHLLTWPYFAAAPFKLSDPGTRFSHEGEKPFRAGDAPSLTGKLTFDAGVGDAPDDWYLAYADAQTGQLQGMAYIVTYGKKLEDAEKSPHAISYSNYQDVDGALVSMTWEFWPWNEAQGIHGEPRGRVELSEAKFVEPDPNAFEKPQNAQENALQKLSY